MWLCRPATLHTREGQPALWEFPRDHRREGRPRHHHRQLWPLSTHGLLRLRLHHQWQRSGWRERHLRRRPRGLGGRRMGPHDHRHQQWHRSSGLQHGPGGSDTVIHKGMVLVNPQVISTHELTGSGKGVPEHWPKIFFFAPLIVRRTVDCSAQSRKTSICYRKHMKSANALMHSLQVAVGSCCISEAFVYLCSFIGSICRWSRGSYQSRPVLNAHKDWKIPSGWTFPGVFVQSLKDDRFYLLFLRAWLWACCFLSMHQMRASLSVCFTLSPFTCVYSFI